MPFGVPMPIFGVAGFLALGAVSAVSGPVARVAQLVLAAAASLGGLGLFLIQALSIGRFCPYCCVADASGVASALVAGVRLWRIPDASPHRATPFVGGAALVASLAATLVVGFRAAPQPSAVPSIIGEELTHTPRGSVTVVDFVDFECPFCRMTHAALEPILDSHAGRVRVIRRQVPLKSHAHALDAARAACCAELLGRGDAMADALFSSPVSELTREGCEKLAERVGLELGKYRACVESPATDARIEKDRAVFKEAGGYALPTIWIGDQQLVGAQSAAALSTAIETALARAGS
jgi:protein-disulfide isomerase